MYDYGRSEKALRVVAILAAVLGLTLFVLDHFGIRIPTVPITARDLERERR